MDNENMMYEYAKKPTRDLAEREISEDGMKQIIPTDWTGLGFVQDMAMNPSSYSPITPLNRTERIYSAFQAVRNKDMIRDAYNIIDVPDRDIEVYRNRAALEEKEEHEQLILAAAEESIKQNQEPRAIQKLLGTPESAVEVSTSLEKKSIENPTEEALNNNLDLRMFQFNNAMKMKEDDTDLFIKAQIGQSFIDRSEEAVKDRNLMQQSMEFLASLIPGFDVAKVNLTDPLGVGKHFLTITTRKEQQEVIKEAALHLSKDDYKAFLEGVNGTLNELTGDRVAVNNFWKEVFGTASIAPTLYLGIDTWAATKGMKLVDKIFARNAKIGIEGAEAASKVGNTSRVVKEITDTLTGTAVGNKRDLDAVKAITDTAMDPNKDIVNTSSYRSYLESVSKAQSQVSLFDDAYNSVAHPEFISKDQQEHLEKAIKEWVDKNVSKTPSQNYFDYAQYSFEKDAQGNLQSYIDFATGSDNKQMFVSKEAADSFISKLPFLPGEAEAVQNVNGWTVRVKLNVPEQGVILGYDGWSKDGKKWKMNRGLAYIRRSLGVPDEAMKQGLAMSSGKTATKQKLWKQFNTVAKKLSKAEQDQVDAMYKQSIYEASQDTSWDRYSDDVLKSRFNLNDKQIDLVHTFYKISDDAAAEKSLSWVHMMQKKGMSNIRFKGASIDTIGKQAEKVNKEILSRSSFADASKLGENGEGIYGFGELTDEAWKDLESKGYAAIKLWRPEIMERGGKKIPVQYIIAPKENIVSKQISPTYFGFHPEGSRGYSEDSFYMKQPSLLTGSNGETLINTSRTVFADINPVTLNEQAKELNEAMKIYRPYAEGTLGEVEASIRLNESTAGNKWVHFASVEDMEKNIGADKLIPDYRYDFEVVRSGEELKQVAEAKARGGVALYDEDDFANVIFDLERSDKRGKGLLTTFQGDTTPIIGFQDMVERNINTISYLKYNKPYTEYMGRELRQQFGDLIKPQYESLSDEELLRNDKIFKDVPAGSENVERISAAKNLQDFYKLRTNVKTDYDRFFEHLGTKTAETLGLSKDSMAGKVIRDIEPTKLVKSWNWLTTMGGFNIKQFLTQAAGTFDAMLIAPKQSSRVISRYMSLRQALAAETKEQIEEASKGIARFGMINEKESKTLVDALRRLAADSTEGRLSSYASINGLKGLSDASTIFFREGEKFNAITAHGAAILEYLADHPEKAGKALTNEELLSAFLKGDSYYLSMSTASTSKLERTPIVSAVTQFTSFTTSAIEAVLGKRLTAGQKTSLIAGNLLAFGTAGTLGIDGFNFYSNLNDQGVPLEVTEIMRTGTINGLIRAAGGHLDVSSLGWEVLTSGLIGKGKDAIDSGGVVDIVRAIPAISGMKIAADIPGVIKDVGQLLVHWVDPQATDSTIVADLKALYNRNTPTGISNYLAAAIMAKTGSMYDKKGRLKAEDPDAWDIFGKVFGFERDYNAIYKYTQDILDNKVDLAKEAADSLRRHFIEAHEKNDYQSYMQAKEVIINGLPDSVQRDAEEAILDMERSIESLDTTLNKHWNNIYGDLSGEEQDKILRHLEEQGVKVTW